jgi:hypothetical protein
MHFWPEQRAIPAAAAAMQRQPQRPQVEGRSTALQAITAMTREIQALQFSPEQRPTDIMG